MNTTPTNPEGGRRVVLYVEMEPDLKERLTALAKRRFRKISAEAILAIDRYLEEEEAKEAEAEHNKGKQHGRGK
jgi:predicted transcriptional regulator